MCITIHSITLYTLRIRYEYGSTANLISLVSFVMTSVPSLLELCDKPVTTT